MWLCNLSGSRFEDTFENAQWGKVKQKQPMQSSIPTCNQLEDDAGADTDNWDGVDDTYLACQLTSSCRLFRQSNLFRETSLLTAVLFLGTPLIWNLRQWTKCSDLHVLICTALYWMLWFVRLIFTSLCWSSQCTQSLVLENLGQWDSTLKTEIYVQNLHSV